MASKNRNDVTEPTDTINKSTPKGPVGGDANMPNINISKTPPPVKEPQDKTGRIGKDPTESF